MGVQEIRCKDCIVKSIPAGKLTTEQLNILNSNCARISFKKGEGPNGRDEIMKITRAPAYIGVPSVMGGRNHQYSCTALERTSVCFIDLHIFDELLLTNSYFSRELILNLSRDLLEHFTRCVNKTQKQLNGNLAEALLHLSENIYSSDSFNLSLTRAELGALIGTTRKTVTRILHENTENDLISIQGKHFKILNKDRLQRISDAG